MEHPEGHLQTVIDFFGITDVRFVRAEGRPWAMRRRPKLWEAAAQAQLAIGNAANQPQVAVAA